ncbi:hypothetical protein CORC01_07687 [Colletotrichum orchidophilum]|uniref:Uncharacterized protein n=1 Tax=Colletotrichum orchidophilum TaxID=1209926 RepID=A0A1G4B6L3_9PEZI|nr:uncharacterized protein CORC01_07687 [Colletotrichum orchidophilum]OHE97078.1 hypothetical protein CORC01_07687 [Colletotrichum orchidophilum]
MHADTVAGAWFPGPRGERHDLNARGPRSMVHRGEWKKKGRRKKVPFFLLHSTYAHTLNPVHRVPSQPSSSGKHYRSATSVSTGIHFAWIPHGCPWKEWHGDLDEPNRATYYVDTYASPPPVAEGN